MAAKSSTHGTPKLSRPSQIRIDFPKTNSPATLRRTHSRAAANHPATSLHQIFLARPKHARNMFSWHHFCWTILFASGILCTPESRPATSLHQVFCHPKHARNKFVFIHSCWTSESRPATSLHQVFLDPLSLPLLPPRSACSNKFVGIVGISVCLTSETHPVTSFCRPQRVCLHLFFNEIHRKKSPTTSLHPVL